MLSLRTQHNLVRTNGSELVDKLTSTRSRASLCAHCNTPVNDTPTGPVTVPKLTVKDQKVGGGPILGNLCLFSKILRQIFMRSGLGINSAVILILSFPRLPSQKHTSSVSSSQKKRKKNEIFILTGPSK